MAAYRFYRVAVIPIPLLRDETSLVKLKDLNLVSHLA